MGQIFVSYSRRDLKIVDHIVEKLEQVGIRVWLDRDDIKAGRTWRVQIVQAIDTCDAFILMLSSNSAISDNVRKEIDLAQDSGRPVFILRLEPVRLPPEMRYQLVGLQHIDVQQLGMDDGVHQLIDNLRDYLATLKKPEEDETTRQAELVLDGKPEEFGSQKQEQTIDLISALTDTPVSQLEIASLTSGSIHVFVDMPANAAFQLKTRALNRDRLLKQFGVKSLRLAGDRKYVNISLGILTATASLGFLNLLWAHIPSIFPSLFGVAAGKVVAITSAVVVTTALGMVASGNISVARGPALTVTPQPIRTPTPNLPTQTPAPVSSLQPAVVIKDAYCRMGPGPQYEVVSTVRAGTRVDLLGRGSVPGWWIILNPRYQIPCWMEDAFLQFNRDDFINLPIYTPPAPPESVPRTGHPPTVPSNSNKYCFYFNGKLTCIPKFTFPTSTPIPPPPN